MTVGGNILRVYVQSGTWFISHAAIFTPVDLGNGQYSLALEGPTVASTYAPGTYLSVPSVGNYTLLVYWGNLLPLGTNPTYTSTQLGLFNIQVVPGSTDNTKVVMLSPQTPFVYGGAATSTPGLFFSQVRAGEGLGCG